VIENHRGGRYRCRQGEASDHRSASTSYPSSGPKQADANVTRAARRTGSRRSPSRPDEPNRSVDQRYQSIAGTGSTGTRGYFNSPVLDASRKVVPAGLNGCGLNTVPAGCLREFSGPHAHASEGSFLAWILKEKSIWSNAPPLACANRRIGRNFLLPHHEHWREYVRVRTTRSNR